MASVNSVASFVQAATTVVKLSDKTGLQTRPEFAMPRGKRSAEKEAILTIAARLLTIGS